MKRFVSHNFFVSAFLCVIGLCIAVGLAVACHEHSQTGSSTQGPSRLTWLTTLMHKIWDNRKFSYDRDHAIISTAATLKELVTAIDVFVQENPGYLQQFGIGTTNREIQSRRVRLILRGTNVNTELLPVSIEAEAIKSGGTILDNWGCELHFELQSETNSGREIFVIAIWSNGPNQRNERGRHDDIIARTSPLPGLGRR